MFDLVKIAQRILARKSLYRFNRTLYMLSLHGMGILNWQTHRLTGEEYFVGKILPLLVSTDVPIILDVGANVGGYSRLVKAALPDALVHSFEPHPKNYIQLEGLASDRLTCHNMGMSDKEGTLEIFDYFDNDGSSHASLYRSVIEDLRAKKAISHQVEVTTVDSFVEANNIESISLLKIDTEGHEYKVLLGARSTLEAGKINVIHLEFNEMNVYSRSFFKDFVDLLDEFKFFRMFPDGLAPMGDYKPVLCEIFAFQNIVAIKKELSGRI